MPQDTKVWHYTSLEAVIAMLRDRQMRLTRIDKFCDPFEGSVPKKQLDEQAAIFGGAQNRENMLICVAPHYPGMYVPRRRGDRWARMTKCRRDKTRSAHAICWTSGDESDAMWRLYCNDGECEKKKGQGLALRSTLAKLKASVAHDLYIRPVSYRFYHEGDGFDDELDPFMHKRKGFEREQEVRILKYDEAHYSKLRSCDEPEYPEFSHSLVENATAALPDELPKYRFLDWSLTGAIDAITVSPYASEADESKARRDIAAIDPLVVVELSVLSERRYAPNF